ncbi:membrane-bound proton-translocating pyrophosphatase [Nitrobacter sp. Nb-311A]|nr:membrane-bound proton-translocating pyrophosphatase [Nitrobacter sp. Nb-311A]
MEATTAAAGDLNDIRIRSRGWRRQWHGVGDTEGRDGGN